VVTGATKGIFYSESVYEPRVAHVTSRSDLETIMCMEAGVLAITLKKR